MKKVLQLPMLFKKLLKKSNCKPNKIWLDKGSEFFNRSMNSWLEKNYTELYSTHNEGKSIVVERFIRTLKNRIYKHMNSISKKLYIDKSDDVLNKYKNIMVPSIIKMKPVDVKSDTYINSRKEVNDKNCEFKIGDIVRISKYKNILKNGCVSNWSEEVFVIKNKMSKTLCRGRMLLAILTEKKLLERSTIKNCKKQIKKSLELKK